MVASLLLGTASAAAAQQAPQLRRRPSPTRRRSSNPPSPSRLRRPRRGRRQAEGPAHVPPDASGIDLSDDRHEGSRPALFRSGPDLPHALYRRARSRTRSRFHKKKFDWKPWEPTTVLLKDFGDYGNAARARLAQQCGAARRRAAVETMETFTPGRALLHPRSTTSSRTSRRWTCGTGRTRSGATSSTASRCRSRNIRNRSSGTISSTPRNNVPRWYLEGSAVFFETWMAGGLGRAQGGYDEMVWRAKVRDHDRFFSPLGLESEGIAVDFQVGVNDYLYGTRFFSYLALTYGPEKVRRLAAPAGGQQGLLRGPLQAGVRAPARRGVERLDRASSSSSSRRTSPSSRNIR